MASTAGQLQHRCGHLLAALVMLTSCYDARAAVRRMVWQGSRKAIDVQISLNVTPPPNVSVPPEIQDTLDAQEAGIEAESDNPEELQGNLEHQQDEIEEEVYKRLGITVPGVNGTGANATNATNGTDWANGINGTNGTNATNATSTATAPSYNLSSTNATTEEVQNALGELEQMQFTVRSLQNHMSEIRSRLAQVTNDVAHVQFRIVAVRENSARLQEMAVIRQHIFEQMMANVSEQHWNLTSMQAPLDTAEEEFDRVNTTLEHLRRVPGDVSKVQEVNNRISEISEPESADYVGDTERRVADLVQNEKNFSTMMYSKIRNTFVRRLRYNVDDLRNALEKLRLAHAPESSSGADDSTEPLGAMLGLTD